MEKRRLGRTDHWSTLAIFGAAAFYEISQQRADETLQLVLEAGINHIDVAPSYGQAEIRLAPMLREARDRFFISCKTMERRREQAAAELRRSLATLNITSFDLFQLHAVETIADLDQATGNGGALEAVLEAKEEGLTQYIGITSHGWATPSVLLEALDRFEFDTVLFPINANFYANSEYKRKAMELLLQCKKQDIGTMIIKAIAKGAWSEGEKAYTTWYEPYDTFEEIQQGVNFALSQEVTAICTAADPALLPMMIEACEQFTAMDLAAQENQIEQARGLTPIFQVEA